jgi:hypothetical protein
LPDSARDALRLNEQEYRVAETEVDIWFQLISLGDQLKQLEDDPGATAKLLASKKKLENGMGTRTKSMLAIPEYVTAINRVLQMPGMHAEFTSSNFEVFVKGRAVEVPSLSTSWELPAHDFDFFG